MVATTVKKSFSSCPSFLSPCRHHIPPSSSLFLDWLLRSSSATINYRHHHWMLHLEASLLDLFYFDKSHLASMTYNTLFLYGDNPSPWFLFFQVTLSPSLLITLHQIETIHDWKELTNEKKFKKNVNIIIEICNIMSSCLIRHHVCVWFNR